MIVVKLTQDVLLDAISYFEHGASYQEVADSLGMTPRCLYQWKVRSAEHQVIDRDFSPFNLGIGWFHEVVARARGEALIDHSLDDCSDEELAALGIESRYFERPPQDVDDIDIGADIADLQARAAAEPQREKAKPDAPVPIMRVSHPSDPPERLTGRPVEKTVAEIERSHPRAAPEGWSGPPLQPPTRPSYARPIPIEGAGLGHQGPPDTMRQTVSTREYHVAERLNFGNLALRGPDGKPLKM
jgi:hypothetical protein